MPKQAPILGAEPACTCLLKAVNKNSRLHSICVKLITTGTTSTDTVQSDLNIYKEKTLNLLILLSEMPCKGITATG